MPIIKIEITIERSLLELFDSLVKQRIFPNRNKAIQVALKEKIEKPDINRLATECSKLDPVFEQSMADEGLREDFET